MGMRVIAVKRRPHVRFEDGFRLPGTGDPEGLIPEQILGPKDLSVVAALADALVVTMPLTSQTVGLIDASVFAALPPHAWLINVARGKIVDEDALVAALREQRLAGAILDVFREQPLPQASPLWDMPNVIIAPHISGVVMMAGRSLLNWLSRICAATSRVQPSSTESTAARSTEIMSEVPSRRQSARSASVGPFRG